MKLLYKSEEELLYKANEAIGKTFIEIDKTGRLKRGGKGNYGQIVEESHFGYEINSDQEPDFKELGIELKVTPIKRNKNGTISSKERLVLNIINFMEEVNKDFYTSSFWTKNRKILMMFYFWNKLLQPGDYKLVKAHLHEYPEEDLAIIMQDWEFIVNKIKNGQAHLLSEADTVYLGACSKGASKKSVREQPFSDIPAMQRAFSLKQSYMTALARKIFQKEDLVRITDANELSSLSFEGILHKKFQPYVGMLLTDIAIMKDIKVNSSSKSFLQEFVSSLLNIKGTKLNQIEEFAKANIELKTVRLEPNGVPQEHMSFKNIDFIEFAGSKPKKSWIYEYFEQTKILFVVFEYKETKHENPERDLYFKGIKLWNMPEGEIQNVLLPFLKDLHKLVLDGIELIPTKQKARTIVRNNLPKPTSNGMCHIRPKARNGKDQTLLPDGRLITKQAFWLDREYVSSICI